MRNRIEVSGYKFVDKKVAESESERIINDRKNRIAAAKKTWKDAVDITATQQENVKGTESSIVSLTKQIEEKNAKLEELRSQETPDNKAIEVLNIELAKNSSGLKSHKFNLTEQKKQLSELQSKAETERQIKVKKIKKLNIRAYQLLPVKSIGKRGSNWIFESESTLKNKQ
jgi:uncharacterized protein involved in exopolysaccharide biosynthesis